jgi:type I restriction enzyme S subunit
MQTGALHEHLNCSIIRYLQIPIPSIQEQAEIIQNIDKKFNEISLLIDKNKLFIEKLQEYRQSLITAAVTGKLEVGERQKAEGRKNRN